MLKFMIDYSSYNVEANIEEVQVERETKKSIWINGCKESKISQWHNYFDTFKEAKHQLLKWQTKRVEDLIVMLKVSERRLIDIKVLGVSIDT